MDEENVEEMIEMEFLGTNEGKKYLLLFFLLLSEFIYVRVSCNLIGRMDHAKFKST